MQPEDLDVAIASTATRPRPAARRRHGAGLRCFVADHDPVVVGRAPVAPGSVWLAGQGGFGIMTAPAMARIAAGLIQDGRVDLGLAAAALGPERLRAA